MKNRNITLKTPLKPGEAIAVTIVFFIALFIGLLISSHIFIIAEVNNVSMQDTLVAGDKLYVNKTAYWAKEPERGDIIVFLEGEDAQGFFNRIKITSRDIFLKLAVGNRENRLIKRVIGLPGDIIQFKNGEVFVNYIKLNEPYVKGKTPSFGAQETLTVPEGSFFVMGDNRIHSKDSRDFGFVDFESIEGRASVRYWPFKKYTVLNHSYY